MSDFPLTPRKLIILVGSIVALVTLVSLYSSIVETNDSGFYQVKQAAYTGDMSVRNAPGVYAQLFGDIHTYKISDMNYFSKHDTDGGASLHSAPIQVRFNDGGTADISGSLKFRLSTREEDQLRLHEDFKSYASVQNDLIRQVLTEALMQTATLMKAEESYSTRRSEFTTLAEAQVERGIFETVSREERRLDAEGNDFIERIVEVKRGEDGNPVVRKKSPLLRYNIEVLQFVIKDIDFDSTIDALIAKKKEAEQAKVVAKSNAERAKQDAKAQLVVKKAEADAAKLLVAAGLTPLDRANIEKETAIGVAKALATIKLPNTFIAGGSGKNGNGSLDPFTAIGLESLLNISKQMSKQK